MSFFGQNIRFLRNRQQMSQAAFAQLFGLTRATLGAYEEERAEPRVELFVKIAKHFGISLEDLLCKSLTGDEVAASEGKDYDIPFIKANEAAAYIEAVAGGDSYACHDHISIPGIDSGTIAFEYGNNILIVKDKRNTGGLFEPNKGKYFLLLKRRGLSIAAANGIATDALRIYEIAYIIKCYDGDDHTPIMLDSICNRLGKIEDRLP